MLRTRLDLLVVSGCNHAEISPSHDLLMERARYSAIDGGCSERSIEERNIVVCCVEEQSLSISVQFITPVCTQHLTVGTPVLSFAHTGVRIHEDK